MEHRRKWRAVSASASRRAPGRWLVRLRASHRIRRILRELRLGFGDALTQIVARSKDFVLRRHLARSCAVERRPTNGCLRGGLRCRRVTARCLELRVDRCKLGLYVLHLLELALKLVTTRLERASDALDVAASEELFAFS